MSDIAVKHQKKCNTDKKSDDEGNNDDNDNDNDKPALRQNQISATRICSGIITRIP